LLVLAGKMVFADGAPDTTEDLERLAVRVQGLTLGIG
jgi:hypothetical protein